MFMIKCLPTQDAQTQFDGESIGYHW